MVLTRWWDCGRNYEASVYRASVCSLVFQISSAPSLSPIKYRIHRLPFLSLCSTTFTMQITPALVLYLSVLGVNALPSLVERQTPLTGTCNVTTQICTVTEPAGAAGIELNCGGGGLPGDMGTKCLVNGNVSRCPAVPTFLCN